MPFFDDDELRRSQAARNNGMDKVARNNKDWLVKAVGLCYEIRHKWPTFTGEDIGQEVAKQIGPPYHENTYGKLTSKLLDLKIIIRTGERVPLRKSTSHARKTDVYRATK